MSTVAVLLVVLLCAAAAAAAPLVLQRLRTRRLRTRFGPEYERALRSHGGDVRRTDRELADRLALRRGLRLTGLPEAERERFTTAIRGFQVLFVEDPPRAAAEADRTLQSLLDRVGYPASGRIEALSVDHARRIAAYRTARETLGRADGAGADTEELRSALLAIRGLTLEVLGREHPAPAERPAAAPRPAPAKTLGTGTPDAERPAPATGAPAPERALGRRAVNS
ncbi:hypothetical protein, partial [Streptomyces sp. NRRL B-24484]|uniref:hypothetical protein n=1 Tax=Streptomyces sp. NRRL B-24484 TaxID=1463833 RepID=UPI0004C14DFC